MQIKKSSNKKTVLVVIILVLLIAAAAVSIFLLKRSPDTGSINPAGQQKSVDAQKQQTNDAAGTDSSEPSSDNAASSTTQKKPVNVQITSTNQDGSILRIRTNIDTITTDGICTLDMSGPDGASYTATANVQALASSSTCQGFDVSASRLSTGSWSAKVTFSSATLNGSASKDGIGVQQ